MSLSSPSHPNSPRPLAQWLPACACALLSLLSFLGCASPSTKSRAAQDSATQLSNYKQGVSHLRAGRYDEARPLLEDAIIRLGGLTAGDRSAKKSRGLFNEESIKTFRGEPYERVMAFYYRGILYWMDGEIDNARACFRSALLEDSDAAQNSYQADYALLEYLDGFASVKLRADGADAWERSRKIARLAAPPPYNPNANVLFFLDMGFGPTKTAGGQYGELLQYRPGSSSSTAANIIISNQTFRALAFDDITFQATTRGGRVMDKVLANKAGVKQGADTFGNAALISGGLLAVTQSGRGGVGDEIGAGLLLAGLLSKAVSAATTPRADTRMWDNLPNLIGFTALQLPVGTHTAVVDFIDSNGRRTAGKTLQFTVVPNRDTVLFVSDRAP